MGPQLPDEPEVLEECQQLVVVLPPPTVPAQPGILSTEKFMKNGAKYFKGTTETNKAEAWTLNVLKTFKVMELPENHWIRLTSFMFEEKAAF